MNRTQERLMLNLTNVVMMYEERIKREIDLTKSEETFYDTAIFESYIESISLLVEDIFDEFDYNEKEIIEAFKMVSSKRSDTDLVKAVIPHFDRCIQSITNEGEDNEHYIPYKHLLAHRDGITCSHIFGYTY